LNQGTQADQSMDCAALAAFAATAAAAAAAGVPACGAACCWDGSCGGGSCMCSRSSARSCVAASSRLARLSFGSSTSNNLISRRRSRRFCARVESSPLQKTRRTARSISLPFLDAREALLLLSSSPLVSLGVDSSPGLMSLLLPPSDQPPSPSASSSSLLLLCACSERPCWRRRWFVLAALLQSPSSRRRAPAEGPVSNPCNCRRWCSCRFSCLSAAASSLDCSAASLVVASCALKRCRLMAAVRALQRWCCWRP
jgi:hypothetical protein